MKMQKYVYRAAIVFLNLLTLQAWSQSGNWCATDAVNNAVLANSPSARQTQQQLKNFIDAYIQNHPPDYFRAGSMASSSIQYVIPVVFHIIHNYGPENISDAQVYDEMQTLKINYQGLRTDTAAIYPAFKPINADVQIEFRLAQLDPNGNCTNGIERIASPLTNNADDNSKLNPWPYNHYLNIWTVNSWNPAVGNPGAYAYLPGNAPPGKDGIISLHNYIGSIGTATPLNKWVITHEAAHWLGVPHIWGTTNTAGVNCGDDGISDTPITKGFTFCPQPANAAICNTFIVENYQNYMDYSPCKYMFTNGQKAHMWAALNSPVGLRNQVPTLSNLLATGTDGGTYICPPVAFFNSLIPKYICEGATIQLTDLSQNLDTTGNTFTWFSSGANPTTATGAQASLTFPVAGIYDVSLTVANSAGSDTYTAVSYVIVSANAAAVTAPLVEGFETLTVPGSDWFIENPAGDPVAFEDVSVTSFSGTKCLRLQNYSGNTQGAIDAVITAPFSLAGNASAGVTFRVAYANTTSASADKLRIFASTNCGTTWNLRYVKNAASLATVPAIVTNNFIPVPGVTDTTEWRLDAFSLASLSGQTNVRLKFEFTFDTGNNLYIDDINIAGTVTGIQNFVFDASEMNVSPNPANGNTVLDFNLLQQADVTLTVTDVLGKKINMQSLPGLAPGLHRYELNMQEAKGIYFLQLAAGNQVMSRKLVVN